MKPRGHRRADRTGLFNLAAAVSAALCVATVVMWVGSYSDPWSLIRWGDSVKATSHQLLAYHGKISFRMAWSTRPVSTPYVVMTLAPVEAFRFAGFSYWRDDVTVQTRRGNPLPGRHGIQSAWALALAWPTLLTMILPAVWIVRRLRALRGTDPLICPTCGYDLRATPGRCPECGHVPGDVGGARRQGLE